MKKILYLECNSGISGDMAVGALLDLGADRQVLEKALESLGVGGYHLHFGRKVVCGLDAYDFDVHLEGHEGEDGTHGHGGGPAHGHGHSHGQEHEGHSHSHGQEHEGHGHSHGQEHEGHSHDHGQEHEGHGHSHGQEHEGHSHIHRNLQDIYEIIGRLEGDGRVKELARKIFRIVAEAESKAHGLPIEQVHFHEVGAVDSIVDIVGAAVCLDNLGVEDVVVSPLSEGHGHVHCQHGTLPVPVPATANIVSAYGLDLRFTDNDGEMVTPTGAAIAAAFKTRGSLPGRCRLVKVGMGAGNRVFQQANVLRAMLLEADEEEKPAGEENPMWVLETNLDDSTGEMLGFAMEALLEAGAADVWHTPIVMKKNRPAYQLSVLCREPERELLEEIMLTQTTTIGIRRYPVERTALEREIRQVDTRYGRVDVKVCRHKGKVFCYPEYEGVRNICKEKGVDFQSVYWEARHEAFCQVVF